jgi:outer membrane biosynthesis protein TonB
MPPAPAPTAARPAAPVRPADTSLYSSTDAGVEPPAWRSPPVSASQLAGSTTHVPALELIVGPDGTVERARLLRSSRHLPDMMILSSAKMWKFEPARLDGEPVRYRLVVRIDQDSALE